MKGLAVRALSAIIYIGIFSYAVHAGGREQLIFDQTGKRILVKEGQEVPNSYLSVESKVTKVCNTEPTKTCVRYVVSAPASLNISTLLPSIMNGFAIWGNEPSLNLHFEYGGSNNAVGIPYSYVSGTNPPQIELDQFENEVITGNFLISFQPPPSMEFEIGVVSKSMKYVIPDINTNKGEIQWAGIFLNPAYQAGVDYNLSWVIAAEAGNLLGLSSSATRGSIMFPVQSAQTTSPPVLSSDDTAWAKSIYATNSIGFGSLSGEVIFGNDGTKLKGVHVELIPIAKVPEFSTTANRSLAKYGAFSRDDGKFKFENVIPGDYVLLMEALSSIPISSSAWDDWIFALGTDVSFNTEFYDGADRESNSENSGTFSPLLILNSAILHIAAEAETTNVQVISQATILNPPNLHAPGSSSETLPELSNVVDDRLEALKSETPEPVENFRGACALDSSAKFKFSSAIILIFSFAGSLYLRSRARNRRNRILG